MLYQLDMTHSHVGKESLLIPMYRMLRYITACTVIVLYTMITVSPLASIALRSPAIARAVSGECAGDCSVCGCLPELSANHICCCWKKKPEVRHDVDQEQSECCKLNEVPDKPVTTVSSRRCNDGKALALTGVHQNDVLPFLFLQVLTSQREATLSTHSPDPLRSRPGDPPDPPPIISCVS